MAFVRGHQPFQSIRNGSRHAIVEQVLEPMGAHNQDELHALRPDLHTVGDVIRVSVDSEVIQKSARSDLAEPNSDQ
jgi:hypothetical protein